MGSCIGEICVEICCRACAEVCVGICINACCPNNEQKNQVNPDPLVPVQEHNDEVLVLNIDEVQPQMLVNQEVHFSDQYPPVMQLDQEIKNQPALE